MILGRTVHHILLAYNTHSFLTLGRQIQLTTGKTGHLDSPRTKCSVDSRPFVVSPASNPPRVQHGIACNRGEVQLSNSQQLHIENPKSHRMDTLPKLQVTAALV